jgi:hypothetical protein
MVENSLNHRTSSSILSPSIEAAWLLGIVTSGVTLSPEIGMIRFVSKEACLANRFKELGELCFGVTGKFLEQSEYNRVSFYNKGYVHLLNDWRQTQQDPNIRTWILDNEDYAWSFLSGFFERSGYIPIHLKWGLALKLSVGRNNSGELIACLLKRLGIAKFSSVSNNSGSSIQISTITDVKSFAENIHSIVPSKEASLEYARRYQRRSKSWAPGNSVEYLIDDYKKAREICLKEHGHHPLPGCWDRLKEHGIVSVTSRALIKRFRQTGFLATQAYLESSIDDQTSTDFQLTPKVDKKLGFHTDSIGNTWAVAYFFTEHFPIDARSLKPLLEAITSQKGLDKVGRPTTLYSCTEAEQLLISRGYRKRAEKILNSQLTEQEITPHLILELPIEIRQKILDEYNSFVKANPHTEIDYIEFAKDYIRRP